MEKKWKKIFLLSAIKIPYVLLHGYTVNTRHKFNQEHPYLAKLYQYLLEFLHKELKLPIKECGLCKIKFLPNHCTKKRQKYCPYGCIELNRRRNTRMAKRRYRDKLEVKSKVKHYNALYRERKRKGQVSKIRELHTLKAERKLQREIGFLYRKLNPEINSKKLKQLDRILQKLSYRINSAQKF